MRKKIKVPHNVRKVQSNVILVLFNLIMKPSNVRKKKKKKLPNVTKVQSHMMLVLSNVIMELSNVRKKLKYHRI